jgi:hypothetical protein
MTVLERHATLFPLVIPRRLAHGRHVLYDLRSINRLQVIRRLLPRDPRLETAIYQKDIRRSRVKRLPVGGDLPQH